MRIIQNRRSFLAGLSASGAAALIDPRIASAEEGQIETSTVRFTNFTGGATCIAPQYVAEDLLRGEGFSDYRTLTVGLDQSTASMMENDEVDFSLDFASVFAVAVDNGKPVKALAGIHPGCYVLFAHEGINSVLDLKGKSVGVGPTLGSDPHLFVSAMATYVGLDPANDINWVVSEATPIQLFADRKVDALLSFPPETQEVRDRKIGHVVVNSMTDRPWSQYFCCMVLANPAYVENYPVATKHILRALLKGTDFCVSNPEQVARLTVDKGYATPEQYDYALRTLTEISYASWRDFDPEDSVRFFALRLHEAGMIKSSPQKIIADGTDWSFFNEIKRELKA